jgi:hypothetical protein
MNKQRINEIKARAEAAAVHEYDGITDLIYGMDVKELLAEVERLQERELVEVKHAHWKIINNSYFCSACGDENYESTEYCPSCGALMDGKDDNNAE